MVGDLRDPEAVKDAVREYADDECVGELGEVTDVTRDDSYWTAEFRTHTFSDEYRHEVRLNQVGNVFAHESDGRLD